MKMRAYLMLSTVIFALAAIIHVTRLAMGLPVMVGTWSVPLSVSLIAILISGLLAIWGANLARRM